MLFITQIMLLFAVGALASPAPIPEPIPVPEPATPVALVKRNAAPISPAATTLIENVEVFKKNFYYINGHKTIGYGHDCVESNDHCANIHPPISKPYAVQLLNSDLTQFETCVCKLPNAASLNANQYGALVSFAFNSGCGGVHKYFNSYMKAKNFEGICQALPHTNAGSKGLANRRRQEGNFCKQPTSDMSGCTGSTPSKTHTMKAALETKILKKDEIDNYIMHALMGMNDISD